MKYLVLVVLFLAGCTEHNVRIQHFDDKGKMVGPILTCKLAVWHSEGGPDYSGCSDGKDHPMGEMWLEIK